MEASRRYFCEWRRYASDDTSEARDVAPFTRTHCNTHRLLLRCRHGELEPVSRLEDLRLSQLAFFAHGLHARIPRLVQLSLEPFRLAVSFDELSLQTLNVAVKCVLYRLEPVLQLGARGAQLSSMRFVCLGLRTSFASGRRNATGMLAGGRLSG